VGWRPRAMRTCASMRVASGTGRGPNCPSKAARQKEKDLERWPQNALEKKNGC
jgi:hypothetical protein